MAGVVVDAGQGMAGATEVESHSGRHKGAGIYFFPLFFLVNFFYFIVQEQKKVL
jgi:hypothetical protein